MTATTTRTTGTRPPAPPMRRGAFPIFGKVFTDSWRSLAGWAAGLVAASALYLPLFPAMSGDASMQQLIDSLPPELTRTINYDQIGTGAGYAQATLFGLMGFLLLSIAAISWGAAALGGDEESGQLELTLAHGVTRVEVAVQRYLAMAAKILILASVLFVAVWVLNGPSELEISVENLFGTTALFAGLILFTGSVAILCGAVAGRRLWGIAGGAAVAVLGYVFNALGNQSPDLDWLHTLSPYSWAFSANPMTNGAGWGTVAVFFGISLLFGALTAFVLRQRDIGV